MADHHLSTAVSEPEARPRLSVVAPCYNEEGSLGELHRRITPVCQQAVGDSYEVVLVNDGSRDRTWDILEELTDADPHIVAVNLSRNHGHQLALTAGLHVCQGERILVIDADLQDPPELLPDMMARMDDGVDVVYGKRGERRGETWMKKTTAAAFYRLLDRLVEVHIPIDTGDFRLMSRRALDQLLAMPERYRFIRGMVSWLGYRQEPIYYTRDERFAGQTNYTWRKMIAFALNALTSFSILPLRLASLLGAVFAGFGILLMFWVFFRWLDGSEIEAGWTSLMLTVLFLGSAQLLVVGVLGEYLGRLYMEAKQRPLFMIEQVRRRTAGARADRQHSTARAVS